MSDRRRLIEEYVGEGKLMQLATQGDGGPSLCNVWYAHSFTPDRLYFISNVARNHSEHIRRDGTIAGGIMHEELDQLGQKVRAVTFHGHADELPTEGIDPHLDLFLSRWPTAADAINSTALAKGETPMRLYEITVRQWVLFDEINFPGDPRQEVAGS